jgi:hypothetical protein
MFEVRRCYTRAQIHDLLGGGIQDYLPHKDGKVVCGCFRKDTNPDAPDVILPGNGPDIQKWARVFREQKYPVPVFIKKESNAWEYVGDYEVEQWTDNASEIARYARSSGRADVTSVLFLKRD